MNLGNKDLVTLNVIPEGKNTSKTIVNGVFQKNVELSYNLTINLEKNGYAVYIKN